MRWSSVRADAVSSTRSEWRANTWQRIVSRTNRFASSAERTSLNKTRSPIWFNASNFPFRARAIAESKRFREKRYKLAK